jgi:hypothetical protein
MRILVLCSAILFLQPSLSEGERLATYIVVYPYGVRVSFRNFAMHGLGAQVTACTVALSIKATLMHGRGRGEGVEKRGERGGGCGEEGEKE